MQALFGLYKTHRETRGRAHGTSKRGVSRTSASVAGVEVDAVRDNASTEAEMALRSYRSVSGCSGPNALRAIVTLRAANASNHDRGERLFLGAGRQSKVSHGHPGCGARRETVSFASACLAPAHGPRRPTCQVIP